MKMLTKLTPLIPLLICLSLISGGVRAGASLDIFPESHDPVLGDRAALVEWAWSPQYAKRFGVPTQANGLKDGPLWLVGVKIVRVQSRHYQIYQCRIVGLLDNTTPIIWPPGERYVIHPGYHWISGFPGKAQQYSDDLAREVKGQSEQNSFVPGQSTWYKRPKDKRQQTYPEGGIGTPYLLFHRDFAADLAYFELDGACHYFKDPERFRHVLNFPTRIDGKNDEDRSQEAVWEPSALKIDIPDSLMQRIFPSILKAADWSACLMRRAGVRGYVVQRQTLERLGTLCDPVNQSQPKR